MTKAVLINLSTKRITEINNAFFRIGRELPYVDFCINSDTVSRYHCGITKKDGAYFIVDANSVNGTFVNGQTLIPSEEAMLSHGDIITIAQHSYMFYLRTEEAD